MATYGTVQDVAARLPRGSVAASGFGAGTKPTDTTVSGWLDQVSSRLNATLVAAGFDPTPLATAGDGKNIVLNAVVGYVAGMVERVWAGAIEENPTSRGGDLQAGLLDLLKSIRETPSVVAVMLGLAIPSVTGTANENESSLHSFWTDDPDGLDASITPDRNFKMSTKF